MKATNWKTTVGGICAALGLAFTQLGNLLDNDPATIVDWKVLAGTLVTIAGLLGWSWFSRDKDVSSEGTKVVKG